MITSFLDNDFYKFTMQQAVVKLFPEAGARYRFINRGNHLFPEGMDKMLRNEIEKFTVLRLTAAEKQFLERTCPYLDPVYLDFLEGFRYNPKEVLIKQRGHELEVNIEGSWYRTILWEVVILALISECYYRLSNQGNASLQQVENTTLEKLRKYQDLGVKIAEFGTRRRFSYQVQEAVVAALKMDTQHCFMGSSNVHMAMKFQTKPIGTHAHEWFMFHAAVYGYKMANAMALQHWVNVYRGDLGIALSDTYTSGVFLQQFDRMSAKLFDGVRHDSGDPIQFAQQVIAHYEQLNIDPLSKTIIFSDGLNYDKVEKIAGFCKGRIGMSFGIGTDLTNDVGVKPMNIVIKMEQALPGGGQWTDVVKLSDEPGKYTGAPAEIRLAKEILKLDLTV